MSFDLSPREVLLFTSAITLVISALFIGFSKTVYRIVVAFFLQLFSASFILYFLNAEYLALITMFLAICGTTLTFSFSRTLGVGLKQNLDREIKKSRGIVSILVGMLVGSIVSLATTVGIFGVLSTAKRTAETGFDAKRYGHLLVTKYPTAFELIGVLILLSVIGAMFLLRENGEGDAG